MSPDQPFSSSCNISVSLYLLVILIKCLSRFILNNVKQRILAFDLLYNGFDVVVGVKFVCKALKGWLKLA